MALNDFTKNQIGRALTDKSSFEYFRPNMLVAWFLIAPHVWLTLCIGWSFLFGCIVSGWEVPASGAVLVCFSLIADTMMRIVSWGKLRTFSLITQFRLSQHVKGGVFFFTDGYKMPADRPVLCLFRLADPREEFWHGKEECWRASKTAHRVSERIYICIIASAFVGTLVWGYAHRYPNF